MKSARSKTWSDIHNQDPDQAWDIFLQRHNQLIFAVINKLVDDHDDVMEIYSFTLERLKKDNCKRLTTYFQHSREYSFDTWIAVVVRNCCMDWFRREKGRNPDA